MPNQYSTPAVQEFFVSYTEDPDSGRVKKASLIIDPDGGWILRRMHGKRKGRRIFELPAMEAWKELEAMNATESLWDSLDPAVLAAH